MNVVFTGQAGLDAKPALLKYIDECTYFNDANKNPPELLKVEDEMSRLYCLDQKDGFNERVYWQRFLQEPIAVQANYWERAFKGMTQKIQNEKDKIYFINLHAVYFHRKTQEYLVLLNLKLIKEIKPTKIITFIDDIYDIRSRLSAKKLDIFGEYVGDKLSDKMISTIKQLNLVLDWRKNEIMMSRFIAKELCIDNFLFAMKHPWESLTSLLFKGHKKLYLSHPISNVRPSIEKKNDESDAALLRKEITELSRRLCRDFAAFIPTTIDEFRVKKSGNVLCSTLNPRWEQHIYDSPEHMFYVKSNLNGNTKLWEHCERVDDAELIANEKVTSYLLSGLTTAIAAQVTSRDYQLVEQSEILLIYKPFHKGNLSGGVHEECAYHNILKKCLGNEKYMFVYCPKKDLKIFLKEQYEKLLEKWVSEDKFFFNDPKKFTGLNVNEVNSLFGGFNNEASLLNFLYQFIEKYDLGISPEAIKKINPDYPLTNPEEKKASLFKEFIIKYMQNIRFIDVYKESADFFDDSDEFNACEFIEKMKNILNKSEEK